MADTFNVQLLTILFLLISVKMANCGLSFKDVLKPLMVATYIFPHLLLSRVSIGIRKAFFHRTAFSYVILACFSPIFSQVVWVKGLKNPRVQGSGSQGSGSGSGFSYP